MSLSLRLSLRLRNATEYPALAQRQPLLGLAFFGVTLTHSWGGAVAGISPSPGPPLLQRLLLHRLLELSFGMTVSGPGTPEPRPSDPGVRTDSPVASPLRTCAFAPGRRHLHGTRPRPGSSPSRAALPTAFLSTGQLSRAAAEGGQRAVQMRRLRGRPDRLHSGPESRRNAPGPGHSAPKPGCLPPQAGEGVGLL